MNLYCLQLLTIRLQYKLVGLSDNVLTVPSVQFKSDLFTNNDYHQQLKSNKHYKKFRTISIILHSLVSHIHTLIHSFLAGAVLKNDRILN